jgi:hypothetical protein
MSQEGTRETVERYISLLFSKQMDADLSPYLHPDFVEDWPQSRERIRGAKNQLAIRMKYPDPGLMEGGTRKVVGSEDRWVMTPTFSLLKVVGTGDVYTATGWARYPNGDQYHLVTILELRDGTIAHQTTFFAAPFEAAEWRREWVEEMPPD